MKLIVSPMYYMSKKFVDSVLADIENGAELKFLITDADNPIFPAADRIQQLVGVTGIRYPKVVYSSALDEYPIGLTKEGYVAVPSLVDEVNDLFATGDVDSACLFLTEISKDLKGLPKKCKMVHDFNLGDLKENFEEVVSDMHPLFKARFGEQFTDTVLGSTASRTTKRRTILVPYFNLVAGEDKVEMGRHFLMHHDYLAGEEVLMDVTTPLGLNVLSTDVVEILAKIFADGAKLIDYDLEVLVGKDEIATYVFAELESDAVTENLVLGKAIVEFNDTTVVTGWSEDTFSILTRDSAWANAALTRIDEAKEAGRVQGIA